MSGIRVSGQAFLPPPENPPFPYIAFETSTQNTIWLMGWNMTPQRLTTTTGSKLTNPMLNPSNPDEALYCAITTNAVIYTLDIANNTKNAVVTLTGQTRDPMPYWAPNGSTIVYVTVTGSPGAGNEVWEIRSIQSDGSNDQALYTYNTGSTFSEGLSCPCFSPSGSYIAFGKGIEGAADEVWIMDSDGSNDASVATTGGDTTGRQWTVPYCWMGWQNNSDVLGWMDMQAGGSDDCVYRKVNGDGTGLTTLATIAHVAGKIQCNGVGRFPWLLDDSAMVTLQIDGSSDPRWRLASVDSAGGGISFLGSEFSYASFTTNPFGQSSWLYTPQVFRSENLYADGRVYFAAGTAATLVDNDAVSVAADGTDFRTDDDGTVSPAHGFFTITGYGD